jgi:hypothetical protein
MVDILKNPVVGAGFGTLIIIVVLITDHKYHNNKRTNKEYIRLSFIIFLIFIGLLHFVYGDKKVKPQVGGGVETESMLVGRPDF